MQTTARVNVLTLSGTDPYGGAGLLADAKTIHALDGYAMSVVTAVTAQNSLGVNAVYPLPAEAVQNQLSRLLDDVAVDAVKIGMLANADILHVVADTLREYQPDNIVLDPVLVSSSGTPLLAPEACDVLVKELLPLAKVITPNLPEAWQLIQAGTANHKDDPLTTEHEAFENAPIALAQALHRLGAQAVVVKGGHADDPKRACDQLSLPNGDRVSFCGPRIHTRHTHGTGCTFASAIAVNLANQQPLVDAVQNAKHYLQNALTQTQRLQFRYRSQNAARREPLEHFPDSVPKTMK